MSAIHNISLDLFLEKNDITSLNVADILFGSVLSVQGYWHKDISSRSLVDLILEILNNHLTGTIFTLSLYDGYIAIYWSSMTVDEIKRIVKLKAFI